jgi:hypothetical protein
MKAFLINHGHGHNIQVEGDSIESIIEDLEKFTIKECTRILRNSQ